MEDPFEMRPSQTEELMAERRCKVLAVATHPVQYMAPIFRRMAKEPTLDLHVAYCSLRGAESVFDPDFQTNVKWDVPLLEGYKWTEVPNKGSGDDSFWGLNNPGLKTLIREGNFDAVLCYVGYVQASFWIVRSATRASGAAFLFGVDVHSLAPIDGKRWKVWFKKVFWPLLFRQADQMFVPSTRAREMVKSLGIAEDRITLAPLTVDNDWWKAESAKVDRTAVRSQWNATPDQPVIVFCAKLQPWKRPMDLLQSFVEANLNDPLLVIAGDGPLRPALESEVAKRGLQERVRFLGFVNQSQLPALYTSADVMVLPSSHEAFAVVVNEAMCCGCPVIVSDQVGAALDLVAPVRPDFVFPAGDTHSLAQVLRTAFADREQLRETGRRGFVHVETYSPKRAIAGIMEAVRKAVQVTQRKNSTTVRAREVPLR
jgi:glycosyltransferase involved in cell wall biosynthesis